MEKKSLIENVKDQYADVARGGLTNDSTAVRAIAASFGYSEEELSQLPAEANMGLSCGNPLALASLRTGETVVDLGCGGGMDVFLAAPKVGPTGKVIGIDMTAEMLDRARAGQQKLGLTNVEFYQSTVDRLPLPDNSVDCVISNCVINLVPDKLPVLREVLRVLKPGGRVAFSDIALRQPLPDQVKQSVQAYVGCIAGAVLLDEYRSLMQQAGFEAVVITDVGADLNAYAAAGESGCCGGGAGETATDNSNSLHQGLASLMQSFDANAYAASVRIHGLKPTSTEVVASPIGQTASGKRVQVYDKPMCCSTGICGPDVDPVLPKFAADLDWLKSQGHQVERYNLAQQPQAFIENQAIHQLLSTIGTNCLPVVAVDGEIVSQTVYPSREQLVGWAAGSNVRQQLPIAQSKRSDCSSGSCSCSE